MIARVALLRCSEYTRERIREAVHEVLDSLGGIGQFVKQGQKVLLKPNMLSAKDPGEGVTTHPEILEAVTLEVQSAGGYVWIGDSPSGSYKGIRRYWETTGFLKVAERTGAKLIHFEAEGTVPRSVNGNTYHVARSVLDADVVINLPKFKTHGYTLFTGAVKNLYGTLPGFQKTEFHKKYPHPRNFSRMLVDLYEVIRPALHLMDGVVGMAGNGPSTGVTRQPGLILASTDGIALDAVAGQIMGFKKDEIDTVVEACDRGLGEKDNDHIEILGVPLKDVIMTDFPLPTNHLVNLVPESLVKWLARLAWVRPRTDLKKCTGCALCARSCPVGAIEMKDGFPVTDYKKCINCLCCNECCPESAVYQEMSWLLRKFS